MHGTASLAGALALSTGLARTKKPSHVKELSRSKHRNQGIAGHGEKGRWPGSSGATWQEREAASRKPDAVCSVLEASRAANSGPTTKEQVPRSRVSRVSESLAAG